MFPLSYENAVISKHSKQLFFNIKGMLQFMICEHYRNVAFLCSDKVLNQVVTFKKKNISLTKIKGSINNA